MMANCVKAEIKAVDLMMAHIEESMIPEQVDQDDGNAKE